MELGEIPDEQIYSELYYLVENEWWIGLCEKLGDTMIDQGITYKVISWTWKVVKPEETTKFIH